MSLVGAIDLGGTKILAGIFEVPDGPPGTPIRGPLARRKIPTRPEDGPDTVISRMAGLLEDLAREATTAGQALSMEGSALSAVGVASPGPLDPRTGVVVQAPNLGWRDVPLGGRLAERLGSPIQVDHDCNLAALAEWSVRAAAGRRADPLIYVTVSTGIGAGIVIGGKVFHGHRGAAGELGHLTLAPTGPACNCGNRGCLEALASGTALARRAREALNPGREMTAAELAGARDAGDRQAADLLTEAAEWLGLGLAAASALIDPELIVLGGGLLGLGPGFVAAARDVMRARLMPRAWEGNVPPVEPARLGEDASLIGAALVAAGVAAGR